MDEIQTPPTITETVAEDSNPSVQSTDQIQPSEQVAEATEGAQAPEAQADQPKVSNAEKRQERTRKAFSELLAAKKAVESENQQLKASTPADTPQTTAPTAQPSPVEPPSLQPNADGEITPREIEAYSKAMAEYAASNAVKPLQAENERLNQLLQETNGNVQQLNVAEIQKLDASDAKDLLSKYELLDNSKPESFDQELHDDLLAKFNALRSVQPNLRLKDYFESEMGALEEYAERIANKRNNEQDKLAAEAPVQTEGATKTPDVKSLHWRDLEKKIGFA